MNSHLIDLPGAFVCRRFPSAIEARLRERYRLSVNADDSIMTPAAIADRAQGASALFVTATERIDATVIDALSPTLRAIATLSVGHDHIDLRAAKERGIRVLHTPDVLSDACAEVAMMLVLNACRRAYEADCMVRDGKWTGWAPTQLLGRGLVGARLGVFGMGRIGRAIARRARGFDMQIHYHNRNRLTPALEDGATYHSTLDAMLAETDVLVIAAPGSPQSRGLFDAARLARLPRGAVLVNISRGDIVNDDALIRALESGSLFAAGLDVFANEPNVDPRYGALPNVFMTPHIGSATSETREAMGQMLIDGLDALSAGIEPSNLVV
jgi:lactate dehydrogenase-like 2-hydroxyacid dehydrogenase